MVKTVTVRISAPLRKLTQGKTEVELTGDNVLDCLHNLEVSFPEVKERLWDEQGKLHKYISIYVNGEDVRFLQELGTPLKTGDEISIVPAMAGG